MSQEVLWGILAVLAGASFSLITAAYEGGRVRGVSPPLVVFSMGVAGVLVFGCRWLTSGEHARFFSWWVFAGGLVAGLAQGSAVHLLAPARRRGPFTPINAAMNLMFVPTTLYAMLILGQRINWLMGLGLTFAFGCIAAGSMTAQAPRSEAARPVGGTIRVRLEYLGMLCLLIGAVGVSGVVMQALAARPLESGGNWLDRFQDAYFMGLYVGILIPNITPFIRMLRAGVSLRWFAIIGLLGGTGSTAGFFLLVYAARLPAGIGFASACVSTILCGTIICTLVFKEARTRAWYVCAACAVAAVVCFNLKV